jgi:uncharacterized protein (TIRG00374 family)
MFSPTSALVHRALVTATTVVVAIAAAASLNVVWRGVAGTTVSLSLILALLPFAVWSYGLRTLRWHTLARSVIPGLSPVASCHSQVIGFAFSATPGRIAEIYKLKVLERWTGTPFARTLPAMVVERLTDAAAFGVVLVVGGLFDWSTAPNASAAISLAALGTLVLLLAVANRLPVGRATLFRFRLAAEHFSETDVGRRLRQLPGSRRFAALFAQFQAGGSRVVRPGPLVLGLFLVAVGRLGDCIILWQLTRALGHPISLPLALIMIGSTGLVGGATLAPGGVGTTEATLIGLIVAQGTPLGPAVVATFGTRALIFWLWVVLGLGLFVGSQCLQVFRSVTSGASRDGARQEPTAKTSSLSEEQECASA